MHDIRQIRNNTDLFYKQMQKRKFSKKKLDELLALDSRRLLKIKELQEIQEEKNKTAKTIGLLKRNNESSSDLEKKGSIISENIKDMSCMLEELDEQINKILSEIPNVLDESVPIRDNEDNNITIRSFGTPRKFLFDPRSHEEIAGNLMDFKQTSKISGSRFVTLFDQLAKLERALANFMLDINTKNGHIEVSPPLLVKDSAMYGVGQLPKFAKDSFATTNGYRLAPTAEVPLTNLVADTILKAEELPIRFTSYTPCFRSEAGSAGRDTKGMIRLHQFSKVELVSITSENESSNELERILGIAESILRSLEIPYRVVLLCSGDTGFSSTKTYDLEVWMPSQNKYREISSCSNFCSFQARRMRARYKSGKENKFVHTLNGSSLAVGRTIAAIIENYQIDEKSFEIPRVLQNFMEGISKIINK